MKTEELIKVFNSKVDYEKLGGKEQENAQVVDPLE